VIIPVLFITEILKNNRPPVYDNYQNSDYVKAKLIEPSLYFSKNLNGNNL